MGFVDEHPVFRQRLLSGQTLLDSRTSEDGNDGVTPDLTKPFTLDPDHVAEDDLICFPMMIAGYSLATKHVGFFAVDDFWDVVWEEEEAEKLFHSSQRMKAVHQVISGYTSNSRSFGYSIDGKGKGLVSLFFGPSGTGKTLTAGTNSQPTPSLFPFSTTRVKHAVRA